MNKADSYLFNAIKEIIDYGYKDVNPRPKYKDGTPAHTYSLNHTIRTYDLSNGQFPIANLRPIAWKSAIKEVLWIYQDQSNDLNLLKDKYKVSYWDEWESKDMPDTIGKTYGYIVKKYNLMDRLLKGLINNPYGRRHIIDLYQYEELDNTDGLMPCAFLTIWNVRNDERTGKEYLDMCLIQRSGDMLVASGAGGVNEVQYAALMMMVSKHCGFETGVFTHFIANEQIYDRHLEQADELMARYHKLEMDEYLDGVKPNPQLILDTGKTNFYEFTIDDFKMINYNPIRLQIKFDLGI